MCSISMCVELAIHANITAEVSGAGFVRDASLLLVVIAIAGFAISGMALYLVQLLIRRRESRPRENGPDGVLPAGPRSRRERSGVSRGQGH